ncbi:hypothetical protein [Alterinioella nitratireducens]|uniref:hypothetical protein n=1 Tax=Alterinioella nitratireducens TaxID=2735915 RepID=UPI00405971C8
MTAQTNRLSLSDLSEEAVEKLKNLDHAGFHLLGVDAYRMRGEDQEAAFSKDAKTAIRDAFKALNASPTIKIDEPMEEIVWALDMLCFALGKGEDLDKQDCQAFWSVANKARDLATEHRDQTREVRQRLRALKESV